MPTHEQNRGNRRHGITPLTRRLVLRIRCARPGEPSGQRPAEIRKRTQLCSGL